jgi:hypothetical protein
MRMRMGAGEGGEEINFQTFPLTSSELWLREALFGFEGMLGKCSHHGENISN